MAGDSSMPMNGRNGSHDPTGSGSYMNVGCGDVTSSLPYTWRCYLRSQSEIVGELPIPKDANIDPLRSQSTFRR
jgi:hypothetical protein